MVPERGLVLLLKIWHNTIKRKVFLLGKEVMYMSSKSRQIANSTRSRIALGAQFTEEYNPEEVYHQIKNTLTGLTNALAGFASQGTGSRAVSDIRNLNLIDNNVRMRFITSNPVTLSQLYTQYAEIRRFIQQPNRDAMRGSLGSDIVVKLYVVEDKAERKDDEKDGTPSEKQKKTPLDKTLTWLTFGMYGKNDTVHNSKDEEKKPDTKDKNTVSTGDITRQEYYEDFKKAQEANKKLAETTGRLNADRGLRRLSAYEERLVLEKMEEESDLETVKIALDWKDLFGGAGIIVNTSGNPESYFSPSKIKKGDALSFITANNWQLAGVDIQNINVEQVNMDWTSDTPFHYGAATLHKSRVFTLKGDPMPYPFAGYARGWGMSRLEPVVAALNKRIKSDNVSYEVLDEAKIDVLRINGFDDTRIDEFGEQMIKKKGEIISYMKNYLGMIMLDVNDEYTSKQTTFSGLAEIMNQSRIDLTASFGLPEAKLWGFQATGFNSGGADIKSYHEKIESEYRPYIKRVLKWMIKLRARQVLGKDVVVDVTLPPLETATPLEQAKINTMLLDTIGKFSPAGNGILTAPQVYEILNDLALFPVDFDPRQEIVPNPQMGNMFTRNMA